MPKTVKEIKAPVLAVLLFVQERKLVTPTELQNEFQLSSTTVPKALYRWVKRGLLERAEKGLYGLGKEGEKRLKYYGF